MRARGWLVDVYETVVRVDLRKVGAELADVADMPLETLGAAVRPFANDLTVGAVTWPEVFSAVLRAGGREPTGPLVDELVEAHDRLQVEHAELLDDGMDLLARLHAAGAATALVSNCAPHTRSMLTELEIDRRVDHLVLSCEVGLAKPDQAIYRATLDLLDVSPHDAVLVDDQATFCAGAVDVGIQAVQVQREPGPSTGSWTRIADLGRLDVEVPPAR